MNLQQAIHWLEQGSGARVLKISALVLGLLALSATVAFKQFHGPRTEETLRQADLGRSIANGEGFTTSVNYPQVHAVMEKQGRLFDAETRFPELYHPPGYPLVIAAALAILPEDLCHRFFEEVPDPPNGFGGDYLLLVLNGLLLAVAAWQSWRLGRRLFDARVGLITAVSVLVSSSIWAHVVAVDGTALAMVLLLGLFQILVVIDERLSAGSEPWGWWALAGAMAGLLFLTDYPLGILAVVVGVHAVWCGRSRAIAVVLIVALVVAAPWLARNVSVIGSPVALASQDLALRLNDSTAEPEAFRTTMSAEGPRLSLNKMGNKVLTALQETLEQDLWAGGGLILTAFFVTGWIYRFKRNLTNRMRSLGALALALMVVAHGLMNSGEGERVPTAVGAPLVILFGAGFFMVLVSSSAHLKQWQGWAALGMVLLQGLPLLHDVLEPRRIHFSYPPYYPSFFKAMGDELPARNFEQVGWMSDVPAGAAWYSGKRVWAQPESLRDFYAVHVEQRIVALVLTPETLDRPFFSELMEGRVNESRFGEWGKVYTGLITGRMPPGFPLDQSRSLAENFHLVIDARWVRDRGK